MSSCTCGIGDNERYHLNTCQIALQAQEATRQHLAAYAGRLVRALDNGSIVARIAEKKGSAWVPRHLSATDAAGDVQEAIADLLGGKS